MDQNELHSGRLDTAQCNESVAALETEGLALLERLCAATNAHDLDELVGCFARDYTNEVPAHPGRGFTGAEQVRQNWAQIFAHVPDLHAQVLAHCADGERIWSQWHMVGRRLDGTRHEMAGVIIFEVRDGRAARARFFLESVEEDALDVAEAVRRQVHAGTTP